MISRIAKPFARSALPFAKSIQLAGAAPATLLRRPIRTFALPTEKQQVKSEPLAVNTFMRDIYLTSLFSFGGTLVGAQLLSMTQLGLYTPAAMVGALVSLGCIMGFSFSQPNFVRVSDVSGQQKLVAINSLRRKLFFGGVVAGSAFAMAPALAIANSINAAIVPASLVCTLGLFLGSSLYAIRQPLGKFSSWGGPLYGALFSLLVLQLAGLGANWIWGANAFTSAIYTVKPYFAIGLFTAFQAYDTQNALQEYNDGHVDVLNHAMEYFLNLKNLFISFLQIFTRNSD